MLVHGDTSTTFGTALACFYLQIPALKIVVDRFMSSNTLDGMDVNKLTTGRTDIWIMYAKYLINNSHVFIFGQGVGADYYNHTPHNTYIDILYFLGVIGSALRLLSLLAISKQSRHIKTKRNILNYSVMICIVVMYFFLSELFFFDIPFHLFAAFTVLNLNMKKDYKKRFFSDILKGMISINNSIKDIFFRGIYMNGGAPQSSFQYLKILKQDNYNLTIVFQKGKKSLENIYLENFENIVFDNYLGFYENSYRYFSLYRAVYKEFKEIRKNKPDLVISLGHLNGWFYSRFCEFLEIPCVLLIAGGDLNNGRCFLRNSHYSHIICFSQENKDVLADYNDEALISVISNRIYIKQKFDDIKSHYDFSAEQPANFLLTSRIDGDKYDSIVNFIDTLKSVASENRKISLVIAGDGNRIDELKKYADAVDNAHLTVEFAGHIDNLVPYFENAHIVVGKGRSVLEPVMMNRVGCVIGDDGRIETCTTKNFDNLYHYNFSGRNLQKEDPVAELTALIDSLVDGSFDFADFEQTVRLIDASYSSEYLPEKFHAVLDSLEPPKETKKFVSPLLLVVKYIFLKLGRKLKRKVHHG